ncbi:UNVERIFIED_CONTAM: hypothetical protein Sradi_6965500 [Sesamum radiatum]|uniref:EF-hand domain-containing protein n=1 Tax=Sesamum radiatum TaxID=300843 RepID=A0AAW2JF22_SESRA
MENRAILREWFDRVDSQRTGNITASQLKVQLLLFQSALLSLKSTANFLYVMMSNFVYLDGQNAFAVGNLHFPVSVVQQMIRCSTVITAFGIMNPIHSIPRRNVAGLGFLC